MSTSDEETEIIDLDTLTMNELIALADENGIAVKVVGSRNTRRRLTNELMQVLASTGGSEPADEYDPVRIASGVGGGSDGGLVYREGAQKPSGVGKEQRVQREGVVASATAEDDPIRRAVGKPKAATQAGRVTFEPGLEDVIGRREQ